MTTKGVDKEILKDLDSEEISDEVLLAMLKRVLVKVVIPQAEVVNSASQAKSLVESMVKIIKEMREYSKLEEFRHKVRILTRMTERVVKSRTKLTNDEVRALMEEISEKVVNGRDN